MRKIHEEMRRAEVNDKKAEVCTLKSTYKMEDLFCYMKERINQSEEIIFKISVLTYLNEFNFYFIQLKGKTILFCNVFF